MLQVVALLISTKLTLSSPDCDGFSCNCTYSFNILNISCVSLCPTGYTLSNSSCVSSSSLSLFSLSFSSYMNFSQSSVSPFFPLTTSNFSSFPTYTKDRGLYFQQANLLTSNTSWVISPWFTLNFIIKAYQDGTVFHIYDSSENFRVYISESQICFMFVLTQWSKRIGGVTVWSSLESEYSYCVTLGYSVWSVIALQTEQTLTFFSFSITEVNSNSSSVTQSYSEAEFLQQKISQYELGQTNSTFSGFLYNISLTNEDSILTDAYYSFISCDYAYYYNYSAKTCQKCIDSSETVLCSNSFGHCYSSNCSDCSSFYYSDCSSCSNNLSAPDCGSNYFNAVECSNFMFLYKGVCIYNLTFADNDTFPVMNLQFDPFSQPFGGIFQSGSNPNTYAPFANPDTDDPIPVQNRGLYFSGAQYLQSIFNISLHIDFTFAVWSWSSVLEPIWSSDNFQAFGETVVEICVYNGFDLYCVHSFLVDNDTEWVFSVFQISYNEGSKTTTVSSLSGMNLIQEFSVPGYVFNNSESLVYIGKGDSGFFTGYIYQILLWNSDSVDTWPYYSTICIGPQTNCVWNYNFSYFLNDFRGVFQSCNSSCVTGCSKWGTCNICKDADCLLCRGFYENCTGDSASTCFEDLQLTDEKYCCAPQCKECFGEYFYNCRTCFDGTILVINVCVVQCPIGFVNVSNECEARGTEAIILGLGGLDKQVVDSVGNISFWSGSEIMSSTGSRRLFPAGFLDFGQYDPVPSVSRGSYFTANSFMQSDPFLVFYSSSMIFYIKIYADGVIFGKYNSYLSVSSSSFDYFLNGISCSYSLTYLPVWHYLILTSDSTIDGLFTSYLSLSGELTYCSQTNFVNMDSVSALTLGSYSSSFTGFLYSFSLFTSITLSTSFPTICSDSSQVPCLSNCDFSSFLSGSSCVSCPNCTYGCHTATHCNFCAVDYCAYCLSIGAECLNCTAALTLISGSCTCNAHQFINNMQECEECDYNCESCSVNATNCVECGSFAEVINGSCICLVGYQEIVSADYFMCECSGATCKCDDGFVRVNGTCEACSKSCFNCYGLNFYECSSCVNFENILSEGICFEQCSLGYMMQNQACVRVGSTSMIFGLTFETGERPLNDMVSKVGVEYFGINADESIGPVALKYRGVYFNGESDYIGFPSPILTIPLFSYEFSVLLCLNFNRDSDTFFVYTQSNTVLIVLEINFGVVRASLRINGEMVSFEAGKNAETNIWIYILLSVNFNGNTFAYLSINGAAASPFQLYEAPFIDIPNSFILIGTNFSSFFQGFLYSLTLFSEYLQPTDIVFEIRACNSANISDICLANCNINSFYNTTDGLCYACLPNCTLGCSNNITCSQCEDLHCIQCNTFNTCDICNNLYEVQDGICVKCESGSYYYNGKCNKCDQGAYFVNTTCISCPNTTFFNNISATCKNCPNLCNTCESSNKCQKCVKNAVMDISGTCNCLSGYPTFLNCSSTFNATIILNFDNLITLIFSEELDSELLTSHLTISLHSKQLLFKSNHTSLRTYKLNIAYPDSIEEHSKLNLDFSPDLRSVNDSVLFPYSITIVLYPVTPNSLTNLITDAKNMARIGIASGLSFATSKSIMTLDPTSFFSFVSTAEIYYPISLYGSEFPANLDVFFASLRVQSALPNVFAYMISKDQGSPVPIQFENLGFSSSLMLVNIGVNISIGVVLCVTYSLLKLLSSIQSINPYVKTAQKKFQYGIFIKYWVQSYVEFLLGALTSLNFNQFSSALEIFDFVLAVVVTVRFMQTVQILGVGVLVYLIIKREKVNEEISDKFVSKYGVIFDEFKAYGASFWIYYILFVTRRLFIVFFAEFISSDIVSLSVSFCFSLSVLFYVGMTRCFKSLVTNLYIIVNELLCLITYFLLFYLRLYSSVDSQEIPTQVIRTVTAAWALHIIYSLTLLSVKIIENRCRHKIAKVANIEDLTSIDGYDKGVDKGFDKNKHYVSAEQSVLPAVDNYMNR